MTNPFSLSTVWNVARHESGRALIEEIAHLGFSTVELNFSISAGHLREIDHCVSEGVIAVSSVHNYCPYPEDVPREEAYPDCHSLSSIDESERKRAVAFTQRSIETAARLKAKAVVVHAGYVASERRTRELIGLVRSGKQDTKVFQDVFFAAQDERQSKVNEHFDAVCTSLSELVPSARDHNIQLGIENRFYYREIPNPDELKKLFHYFESDTVGYWHDIGHAVILEQLGFYPPMSYLREGYRRMIGMHMHDVTDFVDHSAPFTGCFDWRLLRRIDLASIIKVIEVHNTVTPTEIKQAVARLQREVLCE